MEEIELLIAEDEPVARQAMARLFDLETDIKVVGEAEETRDRHRARQAVDA